MSSNPPAPSKAKKLKQITSLAKQLREAAGKKEVSVKKTVYKMEWKDALKKASSQLKD